MLQDFISLRKEGSVYDASMVDVLCAVLTSAGLSKTYMIRGRRGLVDSVLAY